MISILSRLAFLLSLTAVLASGLSLHAEGQTAASSRQLAFARDEKIWVADASGNGVRKVGDGVNPRISPDGTLIAYNTEEPSSADRHIAVLDLTGKSRPRIFKSIPSANCYGPIWAPDGRSLTFKIFDGKNWGTGLIDLDDTKFTYLQKGDDKHPDCSSPCWAPDGKTIFCQDLDYVYRLGLDGQEVGKWKISDLFPGGSLNSGTRMEVSPDGSKIVMEVDMDEPVARKGWDGPLTSLWLFDFNAGKAERLSPKKELDLDPCWLSPTEILCVDTPPGSKLNALFKITLGTKGRKLFLKNAYSPSLSRAE